MCRAEARPTGERRCRVEACATLAERDVKQSLALTYDCYMLIQIVVSGQVDGSRFLDS